jgi:hypothetical protein
LAGESACPTSRTEELKNYSACAIFGTVRTMSTGIIPYPTSRFLMNRTSAIHPRCVSLRWN